MSKSIKKNFVMNIILTMSSFIFPLITFPYVSRVLLPVGTGKVAFATSVVTYFSMFAQLGIPTYGIRACAQVRDDREKLSKVVQELWIINMVMTIGVYILFFCSLYLVPRMRSDKILFIIIGSMIFFNSIGMEWVYKALEEYTYITIRSIIFKIIALGMMFLLVKNREDYVIYGMVSILASSASNIMNCINIHKYINLQPIGNYNFKQHVKPIMLFFAMACATTIYTNFDTVMLGFMKSDEEVGYYNAAIRIKNILVSIITSLGTVLLPRASYYVENGLKEEFKKIAQKSTNFVFLLAIPIIIYFSVFARECIIFLSGDAYIKAIKPMQVLMPTLLFIGLTNIIGLQIMVPLELEKWSLYSYIIGAGVDLVLNMLLIPSIGATGAAIGTVAAEIVVLAYQFQAVKKHISNIFVGVQYKKIVLSTLAAILISVWTKLINVNCFITLAVSASLFFAGYGITLLILKEQMVCDVEMQIFDKIKSRIKGI